MSKGVLIFSGYNIRAVIAFCRWARMHNIPLHIVARNKSDPIFLTTYCDSVFFTRKNEHLVLEDFCDWINCIREQYSYQEVLVLPSTEFLNRFMLHNRTSIEMSGGIVPLVSQSLYELISDKYTFGELCQNFGISVPEEYQNIPDEFPFVAKPKSYASILNRQLKPYLIYSELDLDSFLSIETKEDYYFQQYIYGQSLYLLSYISKNGEPVLFSQENLMQQPHGGSVILARTNGFYRQHDAQVYLKLLKTLGFHGLIMIEVRFHKEVQKFFMIEANPRLWGPMQFIVDKGIDIFGSFLRDYGFDVNSNITQKEYAEFYFWSGGLADKGKVVYHNYSSEQFVNEFNSIIQDCLFLREDTINLFNYELHQTKLK